MPMMRLAVAGIAVLAGLGYASAQSSIAMPPAPPITAAPLTTPAAPATPAAPPPGLVQTPVPGASALGDTAQSAAPGGDSPAASGTNAPTAAASPTAPPPPDVAPVPPNTWVAGNSATLGVLDKVDGSTSQVSIPVGGQATVGDLQVSVQACVNRPADQIPDSAVFLSVQNQSDGSSAPLYKGWMVRSTPAATVVGDASETFRVIGCHSG
jgi:hypothetical protein